jgi:hypothetical protein
VKEASELLDKAAKKMGLAVNENETKIKCMFVGHQGALVLQKLAIQGCAFKRVPQFVYLGSFMPNDNKQDFMLQIGLKFKEENSEVLHLEHWVVCC